MKLYKIAFFSIMVMLISGANWAKNGSLRSQITQASSVDEVKALIKRINGPLRYLTLMSKKAQDKLEQLSSVEDKCDVLVAAAIQQRDELCKEEVEKLRCLRDDNCNKQESDNDDDYAEYNAEISIYGCVGRNNIRKVVEKNGCFWDETDVK